MVKMKKFYFLLSLLLLVSCEQEYTPLSGMPPEIMPEQELKKTLGFIVFAMPNTMQTIIYHIDTFNQINNWKFLQGDFFDAQIDCQKNRLYYFPKSMGKMQAINMKDREICWSLPLNNQSSQWFRGIDVIENEIYIGDYDGYVNVYDYEKRIQKSFRVVENNYMATHFKYYDKITYTFQQHRNDGQHKRIINYNLGLNAVCNMIFNNDLVKWFVQDNTETLLFYNGENGAGISALHYLNTAILPLKTMAEEKIMDVCQITKDRFAVATDQRLYLYNHADKSLASFLEKDNMMQLECNNLTSLLAISSGKEIAIYSISQREIIQQYILFYDIKKFFWYLSY